MKYKVGDRVRIKSLDWYNKNKDNYGAVYAGNGFAFWNYMAGLCGEIMTISSIKVDPEDSNKGYYFMENSEEKWTDEMIEGLVEDEKVNHAWIPQVVKLDEIHKNERFEITRNEEYEFRDENGNVINTNKIVLEKKKKCYPKTFEECVHVLEGENRMSLEQMNRFRKLIDARNAYWKLYGEEMGLGRPWEPDWSDTTIKYCLERDFDAIDKNVSNHKGHTFAFPTEEMRDAFYENFKELIEQCKELL